MEVSWNCAKCFPTKKHHAEKWQQQKILHEKQSALFCTLLPWSPSHVDRNKKKCLWKLFLFPSNKCCILGFRFFLATLLVTNSSCSNAALRAVVENNLCSYHFFHAFLAIRLSNGIYILYLSVHLDYSLVSEYLSRSWVWIWAEVHLWPVDYYLKQKQNWPNEQKTPWDKIEFRFFLLKKQPSFFKLQLVKTWLIPGNHLSEPTHMQGPGFFPSKDSELDAFDWNAPSAMLLAFTSPRRIISPSNSHFQQLPSLKTFVLSSAYTMFHWETWQGCSAPKTYKETLRRCEKSYSCDSSNLLLGFVLLVNTHGDEWQNSVQSVFFLLPEKPRTWSTAFV